ncbi:thrombospondin type 3 repeat-containing protein [Streptococcus uberis]|nr:thrombospondin type 3 repeat-containing protein [Streptococcus uberis]
MEELKSSYENEPLQERIDNFKAQYAERYPKDITNSFINFIREGVEDDDIQIMHQIIDSYDSFPTANQFEKNLPDLFEEFKEIDKLFTSVNRADIPDNVYSEKEVLELLSKLESNSEEGYIWTDESYFKDNFRNPGFVSKVITQYFEEGDIDRLLNKKSVHLTVGDTTFKIDSVDPSYSIYSIEDLAERISEDLKVNSTNTILQKLEELNRDFLDAKDIINSKYHSLIQEYGEPITIAETKKEEYERDSDGDGIPDEIERNMGTNPYSADSDGDGKSDQEEVSFGSNPLKNEIDYSSNSTQISQEKSVSELIKSNDSKGLAKVLKDGVREYFKSDIYINYLIAMSKFHSYSPRNIQLILAQNPNASHVASFKKWKEDFERSVNKGSKALRIFAPVTIKEKDPKTGKILVDKNGKEKTKTYFKLVPVFDVSQTNGKELAKPVYDLEGTYQDYGNLYKAAKEVSEANGVPITFENDLDGAHGTYSRQTNSISILKGMSEQQTLKTLFHEMAHSELHTLDKLLENPLSRSTKELQAESVAFVVSNHYGLDTSEYSFGYLASWAEDKEGLTDLEGQIKIVQKEANNLITKIDSVLEKYQNKEVTKDAFQEKLSQFKSKSPEKGHEIKEEVKVKEPSKKEVKSDNEMSL